MQSNWPSKKPHTPKMIGLIFLEYLKKELGYHREAISRALVLMEKMGLTKCLNPKQPIYRYSQLTKKGKELLKN